MTAIEKFRFPLRTTTFTLDGANNDEAWGRQTAIATVPLGAIQEVALLTNAFSSEFGWTAGPALNIVTKSGTNVLHGEALFMVRPGDWQAEWFSKTNFCPPSVLSCLLPNTLKASNPVDIPDSLKQFSGASTSRAWSVAVSQGIKPQPAARLASNVVSSSKSTGFDRHSWYPADSNRRRSSTPEYPVRATAGICPPRSNSRDLTLPISE